MGIRSLLGANANTSATSATVTVTGNNAANAVADIIKAREAHDVWFNGAYKSSNTELYNILASCLDAYNRMAGKHEQVAAFKAECEQRALKFKKSTPILARIVTYVFGQNRRRVSAYARVLSVAYAEKRDPATLHTWIAEQGGVEEIRTKAAGGVTATQRRKDRVNKAVATAPALKPVANVRNVKLQMADADTPYVAALGRVKADGSVEVLTFLTDVAAIEAVLAAYGAQLTAGEQTNARVNAAVDTANALAQAIAA